MSEQGFFGIVYFIVCIDLPDIIGLSKIYDDRLAKYEGEMRTGISLHGLVPLLETPAGGFMTDEERIVITGKENDPERVSKIISILRKKTDQAYFKFCDILEKSGNEHWANQLRVSESPRSDNLRTMATMEPMLVPQPLSPEPDVELISEFLACSAMFLEYPVMTKSMIIIFQV